MGSCVQPNGGGFAEVEVTVTLLDVVDEYGRVPFESELNDVPSEVQSLVENIQQNADHTGVTAEELLLELKRLLSVSPDIPDATDINEWSDQHQAVTYEQVFGSVENAIELALAADAGELRIQVNSTYRDES